jgi:RNA polymerase sigma-70 factor (ECF subfamily)
MTLIFDPLGIVYIEDCIVTGFAHILEEKRAIDRLKTGDLEGLEVLIDAYQVKAVYAAYLVCGDADLAKDVVQDAFLHVAKKIAQFDESRPFGPWFLKIVVNSAVKAAKSQTKVVSIDSSRDEAVGIMARWFVDAGPRPEQIVETKETQRIVRYALGQLSPEQRAAVIMHHYLGMDATEITSEMHRPTTTVYWWLRTAKDQLRDLLRPYWKVENDERKRGE